METTGGTPDTTASGSPTRVPTTMTQARTTRDPIIRLEREEARVAVAHRMAAPRPPTMAITGRSVGLADRSAQATDGRSAVSGGSEGLWYHPPSRPARDPRRGARRSRYSHHHEVHPLAKTPRTWSGARTPSGLKRVRQAARRHEVLGPRRTAAKTYVAKALTTAADPAGAENATAALIDALSALDRAAKLGAIHPNAAARRKSRLTRKVNAALGGSAVQTSARVTKQTGKAAAAKAAKARIAAGKSTKAKGAQTAAGKARAALSKTARAEAAAAKAADTGTAEPIATKPAAAKSRRRRPRPRRRPPRSRRRRPRPRPRSQPPSRPPRPPRARRPPTRASRPPPDRPPRAPPGASPCQAAAGVSRVPAGAGSFRRLAP